MNWEQLLCRDRLDQEKIPQRTRPGRTEYQSDLDRALFSSSFRRLGRKTQVHPLAANDNVHTRLTHSLEVSRVGRALGKGLAVKILSDHTSGDLSLPRSISADDIGDIVQAACVVHDLGNPPFGHAGEDAIGHWFLENPKSLSKVRSPLEKKDLSRFEGNAQGFRIISQLENHIFHGGLRLTYATLGTFHKYPRSTRCGLKKFGAYLSEEKILAKICDKLGMPQISDYAWRRHPLAHLVEAADDICYAIIDLEDAVELGILNFDAAKKILLNMFSSTERAEAESDLAADTLHRVNFARLRGPVFDKAISTIISGYWKHYPQIMSGEFDGDVLSMLSSDDPVRLVIEEAKKVAKDKVFNDPKKIEMEIGCYAVFDVLLREFCSTAVNVAQFKISTTKELDWKSQRVLSLLDDHAPSVSNAPQGGWTVAQCIRRALDFISGMTDNYAVYISKQLRGDAFSGVQRP